MPLDFSGYNIPDHTQSALTKYIEQGIPTGGFLNAVLRNNLADAMATADTFNMYYLKDIVTWVWNHALSNSWGDTPTINAWLESFKNKRVIIPIIEIKQVDANDN